MKENQHLDTNGRTQHSEHNAAIIKTAKSPFQIVGVGASAGGLEALLGFFGNVPANSGLAYVIVQHMEQKRKSELVQLLQSATTMKVVQVKENTFVQQDCVYVIPPNKEMSIQNRVLHLSNFSVPHTLHLPIDFFFISLANDQLESSIGVILSGMGADGTAGLKAIKEKGGAVFVQEPSSAKFDEMPRSAIEAGLADVVATVETIPSKIISFLEQSQVIDMDVQDQDQDHADKVLSSYDSIMSLLRSRTGHNFSSYKRTTVDRRIERRMGIHQIDKIATYVLFLQENPQELELLFKEFLIGVTCFFREPKEWELLKDKVIPALLAERAPGDTLRVWVSGCSTGEEAYSLAIVFKEVLDLLKPSQNFTMQIFATDLDRDAIDKAREGVYSAKIAKYMSAERLSRYFTKVDRGYQVVKTIRDMIIFAQQNMIRDTPFTKIDILTCRNLLIYLTPELQKKLMPLFHYSLNPDGFLFLGSAETVVNFTDRFKPMERNSHIYQRLQPLPVIEPVEFPTAFAQAKSEIKQQLAPVNIQLLADKLILQCYSPTTVLVNAKGDILYITGRTGKYLEPASGKVNWNIFAMARDGLSYNLSNTFYKALRQKEAVTYKNATVKNEGGSQIVDISVSLLKEPEGLRGMIMIVFTDVLPTNVVKTINPTERISANSQREAELERELMQTHQVWHDASTEMQISQEELKSSSEELQSSNEELQSTNEELTTTKEEIQSLNEELKTVNFELQVKLEDLSVATKDMKNLLDSTKIATLFLDNSSCVKRISSQMSVVSQLISSDVGRPITDIASDLFYPELTEDVKEVIHTQNTIEKDVKSNNGSWFNARILPYRTLVDKIDGVVITFVNITASKVLEMELRETNLELEQRFVNQGEKRVPLNDRLWNEVQQVSSEVAGNKDLESKFGSING